MVNLATIREANAQVKLDVPLVAVFVGGTSGIGLATLLELARIAKGRTALTVYIIARDARAQETLIDELRILSGDISASFIVLEGQASILSDVSRLCKDIASREAVIDMLWLSAGALSLGPRIETIDGLSRNMALGYWSRMLFIERLLPQLRASAASGRAPRVVSIYAAGRETADLDVDDLDMRDAAKSQSGVTRLNLSSLYGATMTTVYLNRLAYESPGVIFIHKYPGAVNTPLWQSASSSGDIGIVYKLLLRYIVPMLMPLMGVSVTEAGARGVYDLTTSRYGGRAVDGTPALEGEQVIINRPSVAFLLGSDDEPVVTSSLAIAKLSETKKDQRIYEETRKVLEPFLA